MMRGVNEPIRCMPTFAMSGRGALDAVPQDHSATDPSAVLKPAATPRPAGWAYMDGNERAEFTYRSALRRGEDVYGARLRELRRTISGPDHYPATAALLKRENGRFYCTGSATLVAPDVALTAAHCIESYSQYVSFGLNARDFDEANCPAGNLFAVRRAIPHPGYDARPQRMSRFGDPENDIGLLFLDAPVPGIAPARFDAGRELRSGNLVALAGYGPYASASTLIDDQTPLPQRTHGSTRIKSVHSHLFFTETSSPHALLSQSDSGGGTYHSADDNGAPVLVGVATATLTTSGCQHQRLSTYLPWINQTVASMAPTSNP